MDKTSSNPETIFLTFPCQITLIGTGLAILGIIFWKMTFGGFISIDDTTPAALRSLLIVSVSGLGAILCIIGVFWMDISKHLSEIKGVPTNPAKN